MQKREILFRGQTRRYGEKLKNVGGEKMKSNWVYGGIFPNNNGGDFAIIYQQEPDIKKYSVYADTVGQYTGLTDKNGVKIFEGDIIKHYFGEDYGVVKFGEYSQPSDDEFTKHIGFYVDWVTGESKDVLRKDLGYWVDIDSYDIIAGNIHDNSEFLEVK